MLKRHSVFRFKTPTTRLLMSGRLKTVLSVFLKLFKLFCRKQWKNTLILVMNSASKFDLFFIRYFRLLSFRNFYFRNRRHVFVATYISRFYFMSVSLARAFLISIQKLSFLCFYFSSTTSKVLINVYFQIRTPHTMP